MKFFYSILLACTLVGLRPAKVCQAQTLSPFKLNIDIFSQNAWSHRGALLWDTAFLATDITLQFGDSLYINTNSLVFKLTPDESQTAKFGLTLFDDKRPLYPVLPFGNVDLDYKNDRPVTFEIFASYAYRYKNIIEVCPEVYLDLRANQGMYLGVDISTDSIPNTTLGFHYSYATLQMNQYLYGPEAKEGFADSAAYIITGMPLQAIGADALFSYRRTHIIQSENSDSYYIRGQNDNDIFKIEFLWSF